MPEEGRGGLMCVSLCVVARPGCGCVWVILVWGGWAAAAASFPRQEDDVVWSCSCADARRVVRRVGRVVCGARGVWVPPVNLLNELCWA